MRFAPCPSPAPEPPAGHIGPTLRVQTSQHGDVDDPSSADLRALLDRAADEFDHIIVVSTLDPDGTTFIQAASFYDGTWQVEVRAGGDETQVFTIADDIDEAFALLSGWAYRGQVTWSLGSLWEPVF